MTEDVTPPLLWETPRAIGRRAAVDWVKLLTPLMEHPGEWARARTCASQGNASSTTFKLNHRMYIIPEGQFEFVTRKLGPTEWGIYARFLGNGDDDD